MWFEEADAQHTPFVSSVSLLETHQLLKAEDTATRLDASLMDRSTVETGLRGIPTAGDFRYY